MYPFEIFTLLIFVLKIYAHDRANTTATRTWDRKTSIDDDEGNDKTPAQIIRSRIITFEHLKCGKTPVQPNLSKLRHARGVRRGLSRIIGGNFAEPYSWPWQIAICEVNKDQCDFFCGGSVIGTKWILTAAHCVSDDTGKKVDSKNLRVKTGIYLIQAMKSKELSEVVHNISLIHVHPKYNPDDITNDIAVLEVDPEIKFTNRVQPVCLPSSDESQTADQEIGWVTGWGTTSENGRVSNRLKQADVPFVSAQKCNEHQSIQKKIQICAGEAGEDACQGDSGGPLVKENKYNHWFQYGVVSNGIGCARAEFPGIYTRVSTFCSFIRSATNNHVSCHNPNHFRD